MLFSILMCHPRPAGGKAKQKALTSNPCVAVKIGLMATRVAVILIYGCQMFLEREAK